MYLTQGLHRALSLFPDREATSFGGRRQTFRALGDRVARLAGALRQLGVQPGDRIAMLSLNSDRYLEYYLATFWAGAAVNPVNTRWSVPEIVYSLVDCDTRLLIVDDHFGGKAAQLRREAPCLTHVLHLGEQPTPEGCEALEPLIAAATPVPDALRRGHDLAGVFYTGGTTGFPKGVMLHHTGIMSASLCRIALGYVTGAAYLHAAPLFHLAGGVGLFMQLLGGGRHVMIPSFEPRSVLETIERERITDTLLVPTMIQMLVDHPERTRFDLSSLSMIVYGAAPISEALLDRALEAFPNVRFMQGYGMTELSGPLTFLEPYYHTAEGRKHRKLASAGRASVFAETRILDGEGREVPRGTVGEIAFRAPSAMLGYWNRPAETAATLVDGWVRSGDGGRMDDEGFVYIVDRVKDMIVSGGENVYSAEVENAIASHPAVAACAVIGIPDAKWGEAVHAVVVRKVGQDLGAEAVIAHCRPRIANYKCPRSVEFRDALPLTGAGKVMKVKLREPYWKDAQRKVNWMTSAKTAYRLETDTVLVDVADRVATITLNRPAQHNALSRALRFDLARAIRGVEGDEAVDVAILTGAGAKAFSAGADLHELEVAPLVPEEMGHDSEFMRAFAACRKPLIAAVNGVAVTGGFEIAALCDLLVAADNARFADTHGRVGVVSAWGFTQTLALLVGPMRARYLSFTGNFIDARTAKEWGLVLDVVAPADLLPYSRRLAADIVSCDATTVRQMRECQRAGLMTTREQGLELEARYAKESTQRFDPSRWGARRERIMDRGRQQT